LARALSLSLTHTTEQNYIKRNTNKQTMKRKHDMTERQILEKARRRE
jgi:hypothetical protein